MEDKKKEKMVLKNVTLIRRRIKFKRIVRNNWQFQFWKRRKNNKVLGRRKKQKLWIYRQRFREEATRTRKEGELGEKEEENRNRSWQSLEVASFIWWKQFFLQFPLISTAFCSLPRPTDDQNNGREDWLIVNRYTIK